MTMTKFDRTQLQYFFNETEPDELREALRGIQGHYAWLDVRQ